MRGGWRGLWGARRARAHTRRRRAPTVRLSALAAAQVTKYQEQSQLLDPLLDGLVQPLARLLGEYAEAPGSADLARVRDVSRYLRHLANAR